MSEHIFQPIKKFNSLPGSIKGISQTNLNNPTRSLTNSPVSNVNRFINETKLNSRSRGNSYNNFEDELTSIIIHDVGILKNTFHQTVQNLFNQPLNVLFFFITLLLINFYLTLIVNIFVGSSALQFAISVIGVLVFVGLTAYDTQNIKNMYYGGDSEEIGSKKALMGALKLYLDFINLFILLLQLFGQRR